MGSTKQETQQRGEVYDKELEKQGREKSYSMNYNEERKGTEKRKETTDEEPQMTKGAYVALKIDTVQKHKVENIGP